MHFDDDEGPTNIKGAKTRPRSRGFNLSKGDTSPSKKQKSDSGNAQRRPKSVDLSRPGSARGLPLAGSITGTTASGQPDSTVDPTDFVHYLREVQKPEIVDVGKLHKLRTLLRNETVAWVDAFILNGGMDEVIELLYRIIKVEWRFVPTPLDRKCSSTRLSSIVPERSMKIPSYMRPCSV
jgi:hypothetical protein